MANQPKVKYGFWQTLRGLKASLRLWFDHFGTLSLAGIVWFIAAATLIMLGPATLMLYRLARKAALGKRLEWSTEWADWRANYGWSSLHALGWLAGLMLILLGLRWLINVTNSILAVAFSLPIILIWLGIGFMLFTVALEHQSPSLGTSLKWSVIELGSSIGRASAIWLSLGCLLLFGWIFPPILLVLPLILALWSSIVVLEPSDITKA